MSLNPEQRAQIITHLITNCDCWKGEGDDRVLNGMSDEKLLTLKEDTDTKQRMVAVANAAVGGFSDSSGNAYRINPDTGKWEYKPSPTGNQFPNKKKRPPTAEDIEEEEMEDEEDEEDDDDALPARNSKKQLRRPRTADEWMRTAPMEVQNSFRYAQQIEQREKDQVISQLLVNVAEADKRIHYERLNRRSLEDLYNDLNLVPKMPTKEEINRASVGNSSQKKQGGYFPDTFGVEESSDMLPQPTMNWQELGGEEDKKSSPEVNLAAASDEEWLKHAPPGIKAMVANAASVEQVERQKLVDQLTANITDEDIERRLTSRLMRKSLDELRDLVAISPVRVESRPNYFGSAAPLGNQRIVPPVNNTNEDLLPLPQLSWEKEKQA